MVYFKIVESRSPLYFILKKWFSLIMRYAWYRRFYIRGKENLPPEGTPMLLVSNHQNAVMDALGIDFGLPNRYKMVFLARADAFKKPFVAKILNFCKVMPIFRQRDGRDNLGENEAIFKESAHLIAMGFPVALFPEGRHQEGHYMIPVKKGFARIAFESAEQIGFPENMMVVPVGNHYSDYFALRSDAMFTFGKPIALKDYYDLYKENPAKAHLALMERVRPAIQELMLDLPDPDNYEVYDFMRTVVRRDICRRENLRCGYLPDDLRADKIFAQGLRAMLSASPEAAASLRDKTLTYQAELKRLKIQTDEVEADLGVGIFLKDLFLLLAGLPFFLFGFAFTGWNVLLGHRIAQKIVHRAKNKMLQSSIEFVLSQMILQGLVYLLYIILYWVFLPHWGAGVFFGLLTAWVLTRALWQDYLHFAQSAFRRLRARFLRKQIQTVRLLRSQITQSILFRR